MNSKNNNHSKKEYPHTYLIHTILPFIFALVSIVDTFSFSLTVWLNDFVSILIRIILFAVFLTISLILMSLSHKALFKNNEPSETLIITGILKYSRNPLYFSILLIYVSFLFLSISVICIILFIIIFLIYKKMINYEKKVLEDLFGEQYLEYKKKVPKYLIF